MSKNPTENWQILVAEVASTERRLAELEQEIREIGEPAAHELHMRWNDLRLEEEALKQRLHDLLETGGDPDSPQWRKCETLLEWIRDQEDSLGHDADFLHQSPPTSPELVVQSGEHLVTLFLRAMKRLVGNHHPLGISVFVNHTHESLVREYGLE